MRRQASEPLLSKMGVQHHGAHFFDHTTVSGIRTGPLPEPAVQQPPKPWQSLLHEDHVRTGKTVSVPKCLRQDNGVVTVVRSDLIIDPDVRDFQKWTRAMRNSSAPHRARSRVCAFGNVRVRVVQADSGSSNSETKEARLARASFANNVLPRLTRLPILTKAFPIPNLARRSKGRTKGLTLRSRQDIYFNDSNIVAADPKDNRKFNRKMGKTVSYLAYDLGASSGRAVLGKFDGEQVALEEVHRFSNSAVPVLDRLYWDVLRLQEEILQGLHRYVQNFGNDLSGIGIDTWGVDFALLDGDDELLGNPRCYRDPRTKGMMNRAFELVPKPEIFEQTGIQFFELNTLYQLLAMASQDARQLHMAETFLMIPDLFNFWLTGAKVSEFSDATTTQFYDPRKNDWATDLLDRMQIPTRFLPTVVQPGTKLGPLRGAIAQETGLRGADVIAPACHDTASAVAAVPMRRADAAYISCGTWALMGSEIQEPMISSDVLSRNFTNEGGACGTFRFLKNITGLWLVQECHRVWELEGRAFSFKDLADLACTASPLVSLIDPDDAAFLAPGDMPSRVRAFCRRTGQPEPETEGETVRCALESLALKFRQVLMELESVLNRQMEVIHIVGGGSRNAPLCQYTANATGRPVISGPAEATALGNILIQAMADGQVGSLAQIREIVRNSTEVVTYDPTSSDLWESAYGKFLKLVGN